MKPNSSMCQKQPLRVRGSWAFSVIKWGGASLAIGLILMIWGWNISGKRQQMEMIHQVSEIKYLVLACRIYAADNDGRYPDVLEDLYPNYIDDVNYPESRYLNKNQVWNYRYFSDLTDGSFSRFVLIASPDVIGGARVVGYGGGQVMRVREEDYQTE